MYLLPTSRFLATLTSATQAISDQQLLKDVCYAFRPWIKNQYPSRCCWIHLPSAKKGWLMVGDDGNCDPAHLEDPMLRTLDLDCAT